MAQHVSRLPRQVRSIGNRRPTAAEGPSDDDTSSAVLYRMVAGASINKLNIATRGIHGRKTERVLDYFTLPLAYRHQLERARQHSRLENPPSVEELTEKLGGLALPSFGEPVTADVVEVKPYPNGVGVHVDYAAHVDEQLSMTNETRQLLWLPEDYDFRLGALEPHIIVVSGQLTGEQATRISGGVPPQLDLTRVTP